MGVPHVTTHKIEEMKDNIRTYFMEMYHKDVNWIELTQDHVQCLGMDGYSVS
jgi:hypothetical protein